MSDNNTITTFGVKVTEETKAQLQKALQDSGLQGKDFMETLLNAYKVNKTKEHTPMVKCDLEELQTITKRINDIYLNMSCRIENITSDQKRVFEEEQQALKDKMVQYEAKIQELKENNKDLKEKYQTEFNKLNGEFTEFTSVNQINQQRIKELEGSIEDLKALNAEYKSKNDTLQGIIEEYKDYKVEIEDYKKELSNIQKLYESAEQAKGKLGEKIDGLNKSIKDMKAEHTKELAQQSKELNLDWKSKVVELKEEHQTDLNDLNIKHSKEIAQYQANYKKVLEDMDQLRKPLHKSGSVTQESKK